MPLKNYITKVPVKKARKAKKKNNVVCGFAPGEKIRRTVWHYRCRNHPSKIRRTYLIERAKTDLCRACRTNPPNENQLTIHDQIDNIVKV